MVEDWEEQPATSAAAATARPAWSANPCAVDALALLMAMHLARIRRLRQPKHLGRKPGQGGGGGYFAS